MHSLEYYGWLAFAIIIAALLLAGAAQAGQATLTWTNPTQYTDNTPLAASAITGTQAEWGTCAGTAFGATQGSQTASGSATTLTIPNLVAGNYCFRVRTLVGSLQSAWSNVVSKAVEQAPPKPPVLATVVTTAYVERGFIGKKLAAVGTVPIGTACGAKWPRDGTFAEIPRDAVTLTKKGKVRGRFYGVCA